MTNDVMVYIWMLVLVASAVLTVIGILRWLANSEKRKQRLNIVFCCAVVLLLIMLLVANWKTVSSVFSGWPGSSAEATEILRNTSKITIKMLLLVLIVVFAVLLMLIVALFVMYGLWAMIRTIRSFGKDDNNGKNGKESLKKELQDKTDKLMAMLNTPIFILIITGGILVVFGIIPIVMGPKENSLAECWRSGVINIAKFCSDGEIDFDEEIDTDGKTDVDEEITVDGRTDADKEIATDGEISVGEKIGFVKALSTYLLVYISILGIGYAVVNILFEIIKERLGRNNKKSFLSEYSNSFGLLAVGVSVLLLISIGGLDFDKESSLTEIVCDLLGPFALVLFIIALGVLTLEIVRLLVDIKEQLIFREARYLFLILIGQCTVIIIKAFSLIYNAFDSALAGKEVESGSAEEYIGNMKEQIIEQIAQDIEDEIDEASKNPSGKKIPYVVFKKRVTRK